MERRMKVKKVLGSFYMLQRGRPGECQTGISRVHFLFLCQSLNVLHNFDLSIQIILLLPKENMKGRKRGIEREEITV